MKKKTLVFILTLVLAAMAVCLVACNKNNGNDDSNKATGMRGAAMIRPDTRAKRSTICS